MNKFFKIFNIIFCCFLLTAQLLSNAIVPFALRHAVMTHMYVRAEYQEGFTQHTKIKTSHGYQSISDLKINDFIDSINADNFQKIILIESGYIPYYFEIITSHGSVQAASAQQFYDEYRGQWIQAKHLKTSDHVGTHQVINVTKIQKYTRVYRINTPDHIFIIAGNIKVHNIDLATACDIGLIIGQIVIQHPVLKTIRTGISLARFVCRLQKQAQLLAEQYEVEELNVSVHENNIIEIRNYYEIKRTQLLEIFAQYQAMKNITEAISSRSVLGASLFANVSPYQCNISLLPALSVELQYNTSDQQKLLIAREQDLANIEQKIIDIQISIAIYLNEIMSAYYEHFFYIDNLIEESDKITELWDPEYADIYNLQDLMHLTYKNTIFLDYCVQCLEKTRKELTCLMSLYTQEPRTLLFQQSSNVQDVCNATQQHISQTQQYINSLKISITKSYQMNNELLKAYPVLNQATMQHFIHEVQQHLDEQEQQHKENISIKQSEIHYLPPPNDPDDDEEKNTVFDKNIHNHELNQFSENKDNVVHMFRNKDGKLTDTTENRQRILNMTHDKNNCQGRDDRGNIWYMKVEPDGTQLYAEVRDCRIVNCGFNKISEHRIYDQARGLKLLPKKGVK
jgi:hypothetical protein